MAMSWQISAPNDSVNIAYTAAAGGGAVAMFKLKSLLLANGGVIRASSDGLTHYGTADYVSGYNTGANGLNNDYAYFVVNLGVVDVAFQRGTANTNWRLKISVPGFKNTEAGYVAGTATAMPIVTDQQHVVGNDAPTFSGMYSGASDMRCHMGIDNASPHHFWFINLQKNSTTVESFLYFDELDGASSGDVWPYVIMWQYTPSTVGYLSDAGLAYGPYSYFKRSYGRSVEKWLLHHCLLLFDNTGSTYVNGALAVDPDNGNDETLPVPFGRGYSKGYAVYKGFAKHMQWRGQTRTTLDNADDLSSRRWTYFGDIMWLTPPGVNLVTS
jgi:hypothetical protein